VLFFTDGDKDCGPQNGVFARRSGEAGGPGDVDGHDDEKRNGERIKIYQIQPTIKNVIQNGKKAKQNHQRDAGVIELGHLDVDGFRRARKNVKKRRKETERHGPHTIKQHRNFVNRFILFVQRQIDRGFNEQNCKQNAS
jgi:hypothetical protein